MLLPVGVLFYSIRSVAAIECYRGVIDRSSPAASTVFQRERCHSGEICVLDINERKAGYPMYTLGCTAPRTVVGVTGCSNYKDGASIRRQMCICSQDLCNVELLLNREPLSYPFVQQALPLPTWDSDSAIRDCPASQESQTS
ncbi:hypothetical protein Q1695_013112 [Nippostrongylus brasiliensis]|nr:hypothetical protein Q1695_013112 [Nippostrongylus brasiliensis]